MFREVNLISLLFLFPLDLSSSRRQSFTRRAVADMLPTALYPSYFRLQMRWLQLELFRVYVPAFLLMLREAVEYEILTQKRNKDGNPYF